MNYPPVDQYVDVGAIRTRYWAVGEGPPIICIHGILRFAEDWQFNIEALAQNYRVYVLDLVGYGYTDKPLIDYSLDDFVAFVRAFMDALTIERAILIGHSLGGGVALGLTFRYPERVERLVLVAGAGLGQQVHWIFRLGSLPALPELCGWPNRMMVKKAFEEVVYDKSLISPELVAQAHERFYLPGAREALFRTIRSGIATTGIRAEILAAMRNALPTIAVPTLIIWGRQDPILPVRHAYKAIEYIPRSTLRLLDECGHFPMFEHPQVFNALVLEFIAESRPLPAQLSQPQLMMA